MPALARRVREKLARVARRTPTLQGADPDHVADLTGRIWAGEYDRRGFVPRRGWTVVDIGANVGAWAVLAARRGASVAAYEPHPDTYRHLCANAGPAGVVCRQAAVVAEASEDSLVALHLDPDQDTRHTLLGREQRFETPLHATIDVPAIALADVLAEPVDLVKMDCEGAELALLERTPPELLANARRIVAELHGTPAEMDRAESHLRAAGFTTWREPLEHERLAMCFAARE